MCVWVLDPVSNRAKVLICHQRAAWLSLSCQSSSPGDKHSASNAARGSDGESQDEGQMREEMKAGGMRKRDEEGGREEEEAGVEGQSEGQKG